MMILRAKFKKEGFLKYISHLDMMRLFQRTFRRANIPVTFTKGFNPHPKFSLAVALPLGVSSEGEYMDIYMDEKISDRLFIEKMNKCLPEGIKIIEAKYADGDVLVSSLIKWSYYEIQFDILNEMSLEDLISQIDRFLLKDEIIITKTKFKKKKEVKKKENIRKQIRKIIVKSKQGNKVYMEAILLVGNEGNLKVDDLIYGINEYTDIDIDKSTLRFHRKDLFYEEDNKMKTIF